MRPILQRGVYEKLDPSFDFNRFDRRLKSLQIGNLKLIASDAGEYWLHDIERDPHEKTNLASKMPDELALLRSQLAAWSGKSWEPKRRGHLQGVDDQTEQELRALGYIQ